MASTLTVVLSVALLSSTAGCSDDRRRGPLTDASPPDASSDGSADAADGGTDGGGMDTGAPLPFTLTSTAFAEGSMIPLRYECGPPVIADGPGENVTPPLSWTAGPSETMSYALVVRDLDAGNLVHWVVYDIAASTRDLVEDIPDGYTPSILAGAKQAELQGSGYYGYLGPCSDGRINTYQFTIHALDTPALVGVDETTTEDDIATAVESAAIASASLSGES